MRNRFLMVGGKTVLIYLLLWGICLPCAAQHKSEPYDIQMKMKVGDRFLDSALVQQIIDAGSESVVHQTMLFIANAEVVAQSGDTAVTMRYTYTGIKMKSQNGTSNLVDYDSDMPQSDDAVNPFALSMSSMIGLHFDLVMSRKGSLLGCNGAEEFVKGMVDHMAKKLDWDEEKKASALQTMEQSFSGRTFLDSYASYYSCYPGKPVKLNESWKAKSNMQIANFEQAAVISNNKLARVTDSLFQVSSTSSFSINLDSPLTGKGKLSGTSTGVVRLARANGQIIDNKIEMDVKGSTVKEGHVTPYHINSIMYLSYHPLP